MFCDTTQFALQRVKCTVALKKLAAVEVNHIIESHIQQCKAHPRLKDIDVCNQFFMLAAVCCRAINFLPLQSACYLLQEI